MLAGQYRLKDLLRTAGLARSTYFYEKSYPEHVTRANLEPLVDEIWHRTANGCGHRQVRMSLIHEFGAQVSAKSVLKVMRRMGIDCQIRARNPWKHYSSYQGDSGGHVHNLLKRNFVADKPMRSWARTSPSSGSQKAMPILLRPTTWPARESSPGTCSASRPRPAATPPGNA